MTIKIYSTEASRGVRPIWTAEEMGLDYEIEMMPFPPRFTKPEYYTTFFGWARVAGIGAQIVDERVVMRSGRGVPIYRPKYFPEGQELRHVE